MLDKLLKNKGWSSKKFAGLEALQMAFILAVVCIIIGLTNTHVILIGSVLTYSATALGIDAYNKKTRLTSKDG